MNSTPPESQEKPDESVEVRARHVKEVQQKLPEDVESLSRAGQEVQRSAARATAGWLLLGGSVLCGAIALRSVYRRFTQAVRTSSGVSRYLLRAALRSIAFEILRNLCVQAVVRVLPRLEAPPQLGGSSSAPLVEGQEVPPSSEEVDTSRTRQR
jgi:hypothetical protein